MLYFYGCICYNESALIKQGLNEVDDMSLKERANQLITDIPAIFLCLKSRVTPLAAKILAGITVVYALSPVDLIPDFIPVLGYLDDVILLPVLIALTVKLIPQKLFQQFKKEAEGMWESGKVKYWYYAIPIVAIWLLILWFFVKAIIF